MTYQEFIKPELIILIPVIYIIGMALKASRINNAWIPLLLGISSIALSTLWIIATTTFRTFQDIAMGLFVSVTQGILIAGASVYWNQLRKQSKYCGCGFNDNQFPPPQ